MPPKEGHHIMASKKKSTSSKTIKSGAKAVASTAVRNTPIPKEIAAPVAAPAAKREVTHEDIALRAYQIWSRQGGDEQANWAQAEFELRTAA
jgi:hypothetical protein